MFVFGMGFVGVHVSRRLREEGWEVSGTCTSEEKKKELQKMGFEAFVFNSSENDLGNLNALPHATHLLLSIPSFPGQGDPLIIQEEELRCKLSGGNLQWLGYLSSTSVYGDCGGGFVGEDCRPEPVTLKAKARLAAEQSWLNLGHDLGVSSYVFRLGGIYGPGRSALDTLISGEALSKQKKMRESRKYTARIHVDDIYQAIKNSFPVPNTGRVYNIVDDDPAPRSEVFLFAENIIKEKWPGKIIKRNVADYEEVKGEKEEIKGEKRVLNTRMKEELKVNLIHPSYRKIKTWRYQVARLETRNDQNYYSYFSI
ncbi:NAD(P)-binding Rossmann-fold superfamily protein isoform X2 [Wolffia australiana]